MDCLDDPKWPSNAPLPSPMEPRTEIHHEELLLAAVA